MGIKNLCTFVWIFAVYAGKQRLKVLQLALENNISLDGQKNCLYFVDKIFGGCRSEVSVT